MPYKLLLADDSATIRRVVELTFSGEDIQVVTVGDGEQAIARIPGERPDIVLADIGMPKRSGYDVAAFVKGHPDLAGVPVLLLAGAFEPVDQARARQVRSDGVLVKPFEPSQVVARVRELLEANAPSAEVETVSGPGDEPDDRTGFEAAIEEPDYLAGIGTALEQRSREGGSRTRAGAPAVDEVLDPAEDFDLPTIETVLGDVGRGGRDRPVETGAAQEDAESWRRVDASSGEPNVIADVFAALFAAEEGHVVEAPDARGVGTSPPALSDALVEEVTRRVIARLAPDAVRGVVTQVVTEVAERLVREELASRRTPGSGRLE